MPKDLRRLIAVIVSILLLRIGLVSIYRYFEESGGFELFFTFRSIFLDPLNLPVTLSLTLLLGYAVNNIKWCNINLATQLLARAVIVLLSSVVATSIASVKIGCEGFGVEWYSLLFTAALGNIIILLVFYVWLWFRSSRTYVSKVIAKNKRTQYQYAQLKRQLDPHFLFNSLSILDYLVQEKQTERASDYIKKLANIYRYLLKQEDYVTVELNKELDFVHLYTDVMRERFLDSFEVKLDIEEADLGKKIIPCALQILVENAFKHNAVGPTNKLVIEIYSEEGRVVVRNNINPKHTPSDSNGVGLKNLREQYNVLADKSVEIANDNEHFTVKIPLL
ncbi:MAG: histidine kinase [Tidjanibacter sp.]|nr:histidine kinase [Tidjanibacter sp.]